MKIYTFLILLYFSISILYAQNLVPNPSFEKVDSTARNRLSPHQYRNKHFAKQWFVPNGSSPDLIYSRYDDYGKMARLGKASMGLFVHSTKLFDGKRDYREYVECELKSPLVAGKEYIVEFWVKLIYEFTDGAGTSHIGCYLSKKRIDGNTNQDRFALSPQFMSDSTKILNNFEEWKRIGGKYIAKGGESYIIIGSFLPLERIKCQTYARFFSMDYYYIIDDVFVGEKMTDIPTERNIVLKNLEFEYASNVIRTTSYGELDSLVDYLKYKLDLNVQISGHTDNKGTDGYNDTLSYDRAKAVADYFVNKGINTKRLTYGGYGRSMPIADNNTTAGRQRNRRVEFMLKQVKFTKRLLLFDL